MKHWTILAVALNACALLSAEDSSFLEKLNKKSELPRQPSPVSCSPAPKASAPVEAPRVHRVHVGGNYTYAWITPTGNPTTMGNLGGVQALYEYAPLRSVYAGAYFGWRIGSTENDGVRRSLQDFNAQERLGYTFYYEKSKARATLFSGVGARYLPETVKVSPYSVDFDYTEFYVPVGCLLEKEVTSLFKVGLNFQWMPQIFPMVRIQPLSGAQWDLTYQINNFFVEMPLTFSSCGRYSCVIAPFFELWHDGASTAHTISGVAGTEGVPLGLPGNQYLFTGVNVSFGAAF